MPRIFSAQEFKLRRIVVKLGTNVIMRQDGKVALGLLCGLVEQIAALRTQGLEILLVSSGAVGLGMERLALLERPTVVAQIQACAAIGQSRLMGLYDDAFDRLGCPIAQVLLTEDDFRDATRHTNLRATLDALLTLGVIPIVNENDTVSTEELDRPADSANRERIFGDNDKLSALLMKHIGADLLVLLTDVDGLYDRHPSRPGATVLEGVEVIDEQILALASGGNGRGRGGMISKLESARIVVRAGKPVIIANGRTPHVLERIAAGESIGTHFAPVLQELVR
jgi:glutamate 5-kinase